MTQYDESNIFAKIIRGELPCDKVFENNDVLAFRDISPAAPVHVLVIPKGPYVSFDEFVAGEGTEKVANFFSTVAQIARDEGVKDSGYRIITNIGHDGSQTVDHFHVHILGGAQLGGLIQNDALVR